MTTRARTIPDLLAPVLADHATRTALIDGDRRLTYAGLRHAVAVAAAHPSIATSSTDDAAPVVVIAPLGIDGLVVQLATMFAGRTAAPMEATLPITTLVEIIESIGGPVVCLDPDATRVLDDVGVSYIDSSELCLDALLGAPAVELVTPEMDGDTSAAVLCFTSGSTGRPKGVLVSHTTLIEMCEFHDVGVEASVSITAPPSFLAFGAQAISTLGAGATGVFLDLGRHTGTELHRIVGELGMTHIMGTTMHIRELARAAKDAPLQTVRSVVFGAQATAGADIEPFRAAFPSATLRSFYGSSEMGGGTFHVIEPDDDLTGVGAVPAGRAVPGRLLAVLDEDGLQVAHGAVGQVAIHVDRPFLGYWKDPILSAAKVTTDHEGRTWILSGDLGRLDVDGVLHIVGRTDDLVKIRGRFVNPTDIDEILSADPRVADVVTIAVPPEAPDRLHTIVVAADPDVTARALRHHLAQSLPLFALPRHIVFVDRIPLTGRGKVDRRALAAIEPPESRRTVDAPTQARTMAEEAIVRAFREVLDTDVTASDDFFVAGGDSLAAAELLALFADEFGTNLSPAQLVANPTPGALLDLLNDDPTGGPAPTAHPGLALLHDSDHPTSLFWVISDDQGFGPARLARRTAPIRSWVVRAVGSRPGEEPLPSLAAIGAHDADAITAARTERTVIIGFSIGTVLALEAAIVLARRGTPADLLILLDPPIAERVDLFNRRPSPLRRPRTALHAHRRRRNALHRPFDTDDAMERMNRLILRHSLLFADHPPQTHDGPTAIIRTEHYVQMGGTSVVDSALLRPPTTITIPGDHDTVLVEPEPLATAIGELLRDHGLL